MLDLILWGLLVAFAGWEIYARFFARNRGAHTLSNRIWALEQRWPFTRFLVAAGIGALGYHLLFQP